MKPNDKAIKAALRATSDSCSAYQIQNALDAAYAAQLPPSEDYAELVKWLRDKAESLSEIYPPEAEAADALEAVLAERDAMKAELAAVTAERDRMQHRLDAAYNVIDKDIKNDMAFAKKHADLWLENERLREALKETLAIARRNEAGDYVDRARAALEGVTEKEGAGNE